MSSEVLPSVNSLFIHGSLEKTKDNIEKAEYVEKKAIDFKNKMSNDKSFHIWTKDVEDPTCLDYIKSLKNQLTVELERTTKTKIINVDSIDEVMASVCPSKRSLSDINLSDFHYDTPFRTFNFGNVNFVRVVLSLSENDSVYTQVDEHKSCLNRLDFNAIDYNKTFHGVIGKIAENKHRVILKLHFLSFNTSSEVYYIHKCYLYCKYWTIISRMFMNLTNKNNIFSRAFFNSSNFLIRRFNNT
jgi:hypothetical protein